MITRENILEHTTRKKIYDIILKYPGIHLKKLVRNSNISEGAVRYHIHHLVKQERIIEKNDERYTRYYKNGDIGKREKKIINLLRKETPRRIILHTFNFPGMSQIELSKELKKDPKAINYHLKKLLNLEILEIVEIKDGFFSPNYNQKMDFKYKRKSREKVYQLKNPILLYKIINSYKGSLFDNGDAKAFLEVFNFSIEVYSKLKRVNENIYHKREYTEIFYRMFPLPFMA